MFDMQLSCFQWSNYLNDKKKAFLADVVTHAQNSIIWKAEAKEFKPTLGFIVNSRLAWAI